MAGDREKLIDRAQRGRVASRLLGELGEPLRELEGRAVDALVTLFRSEKVSFEALLRGVARVDAARMVRDELESRMRAGRVAGERLQQESA